MGERSDKAGMRPTPILDLSSIIGRPVDPASNTRIASCLAPVQIQLIIAQAFRRKQPRDGEANKEEIRDERMRARTTHATRRKTRRVALPVGLDD